VSGSVRWINDTPLVQIAGSNHNENSVLYTFSHEAGHILLHGKKDVFLENSDYREKDIQKEKEADEFAAIWMK
jgi:Zn-dependent peptidase ImmA (M78 family)